jgi:uncharacterized protein
MTSMLSAENDRILKVADLVDHPGASRPLDLRLAVPEDLDLPLVDVLTPVHLAGVLESVVDGLLVRGTLTATMRMACARCLIAVEADVAPAVTELFADPRRYPVEEADELEAGYEILEGTLDLDTLLRDALVPAAPLQPLCRPDCAGLCSECGARLNETSCNCEDTTFDARWAALEQLRLPDNRG